MKKITSIVLSLALVLGQLAQGIPVMASAEPAGAAISSSEEVSSLTKGGESAAMLLAEGSGDTYIGTGRGFHGDIVLRVTMENGAMSKIETVYSEEDEFYWPDALQMYDRILAAQTVEVDAVSGATESSNGIREAVSAALSSAQGQHTAPVFLSSKHYGGEATDALNGLAFTLDGGFVAKGYSMGTSQDPAWTHTGSGNNNDAILLKFDAAHKLLGRSRA